MFKNRLFLIFLTSTFFVISLCTETSAQTATKSTTQENIKVLGDSPATAIGNIYQSNANSINNAFHNATSAQQQSYYTMQEATTTPIKQIYSLDSK